MQMVSVCANRVTPRAPRASMPVLISAPPAPRGRCFNIRPKELQKTVAPAWMSARLVRGAMRPAGPSSGAPGTTRGVARLVSILSTASARLVQLVPMSAKHKIIREAAPCAQPGTSFSTAGATKRVDSRAVRCVHKQITMDSVKRVLILLVQMTESAPRAQPDVRSVVTQTRVLSVTLDTIFC